MSLNSSESRKSSYSQTYAPINIVNMEAQGRSAEADSEVSSVDSVQSFSGDLRLTGNGLVAASPRHQRQISHGSLPPSYSSYYQPPPPPASYLMRDQPPVMNINHIPQPRHPVHPPGGYQHHPGIGSQQQLPPHLTRVHYGSYGATNQYPLYMTDELVSGTKGTSLMSPVRRFYLLLCLFDLLFTSLLWIISLIGTGHDLYTEFDKQIVQYNVSSSMFDCVVTSGSRFLFNSIFYGVVGISHWWVITLTTTGSVAFLVTKVLKFDFNKHAPLTYNVMLVLLSFIITWGEVWYFDLKMIPLERRAREIWGGEFREEDDEERRTLIGPSHNNGGMMERFMGGSTLYEESVGKFYSPLDMSPAASDDEDDEDQETGIKIPRRFKRRKDHPLSEKEREYKRMGEELLEKAWNTINSGDWKLEKKLDNGDMVQARHVNGKKLFKLTGYVNMSPKLLLEELFFKQEQVPKWNKTLEECRILQPVDQFTDISYQVCAASAGGAVSTRDFVSLRHWSMMEGGVYVSAGGSVKHSTMPPQKGRVRGENGPTCYVLRPVPGNPDTCLFQWLLDTDLKGWIPQSIIDKALSGAQLDYIANVRLRAAELAKVRDFHNTSIGSCEDIVINT